MNLDLKGRSALVTAGTAGIGLAIVRVLASEGAVVTFTGRSESSVAEALRSLEQTSGGSTSLAVRSIVADAGTGEGAATIARQLPSVDILINNLGVYESKAFGDISDDDWRNVFEVNVMSGVRMARSYLPKMFENNWGRVLFISSEAAIAIPPEMIHYAATKTAILAISRGLAETTRGSGVTVNTVVPGPTRSAGIINFLKSLSQNPNASAEEAEAEFFRTRRSSSLLQRLINADEVAQLVAFLASPLSAATNGAAVRVEGGLISSII